MSVGKISVYLVLMFSAVLNVFAQDCICPVIKITEPDYVIKAGEPAIFTVDVKGWKSDITYNWSVSAGTILEGQGTPGIKVDTTGLEGANLTATVQVRGDWCPACENTTVSGVATIEMPVKARLIDKFQRANCEDVLMRMDNFFNELQSNPNDAGYLVISGNSRTAAIAEREARNWIVIRRFDAARITILRGGGETSTRAESGARAEVEMWLVPPGAAAPEVSISPGGNLSGKTVPTPADPKKPYIFTSQTADGIEGCKPLFDLEGYIEELKQNPKKRGNIVIYEASQAAFRRTEKEILKELVNAGIARSRLKTFFRKIKRYTLAEAIDLWVLP